MRKERLMTFIVAALMMITGMSALFTPVGGEEEMSDSPPTRVKWRNFQGTIGNLTNETYFGHPPGPNITVTAYTNDGAPEPTTGTWVSTWNNRTIWEFLIEIDIDTPPHDQSLPIDVEFTDWYGWNESGGGFTQVIPPDSWYTTPNAVLEIGTGGPNGTLDYIPGVFGNMGFTIINGSSGEPLEGVSFDFLKHSLHSTSTSGNVTNETGQAIFNRMQLGLDNKNRVKVSFEKENFHMKNFDDWAEFPLVLNETSNYTYEMVEYPLVQSYQPARGATEVNTNKSRATIFVTFKEQMDRSSVNPSTVWLEDELGDHHPVSYRWNSDNTTVFLEPLEDLEYNTTYEVVVDARVKNRTGVEPLWRRFMTHFTTELRPGSIYGTVLIEGTSQRAPEGSRIQLDGGRLVELDDGYFEYDALRDGEHRLDVYGPKVGGRDEYLYEGDKMVTVTVERAVDKEITGLNVEKRQTVDLHMIFKNEMGEPVEDVEVTHSITEVTRESDSGGNVYFNASEGGDVLANTTTSFAYTAENYLSNTVPVTTGFEDVEKEVTMYEKDLPVEVKTFTSGEILEDGDIGILVDSEFHLFFQEDMDPETMTTSNIMLKRKDGSLVSVELVNDVVGGVDNLKRWIVTPTSDLKYGKNYTLLVTQQVATQGGVNILWRDLGIEFQTERLFGAGVSGQVMFRDQGISDVDVEVLHQGGVLAEGVTDFNGNFRIEIDVTQPTYSGIEIVANGSAIGLTTDSISGLALNSGGLLENIELTISRIPDWYSIEYFKDNNNKMPVDENITVVFQKELLWNHPDFQNNFSLKKRGSTDVNITIDMARNNKAVVVSPDEPLSYDTDYTLEISVFKSDVREKELKFMDGSPAIVLGELINIQTEFTPISFDLTYPSDLQNVSKDQKFNLFFYPYQMKTSTLESALEIKKEENLEPVGNLTFSWSNEDHAVEVSHDPFDPQTDYLLTIPMGVYGVNGARIREDVELEFTTGSWKIDVSPVSDLPQKAKAGVLTLSTENPLGIEITVVVLIRPQDSNLDFKEMARFNLKRGESKQIPLDLSNETPDVYEVRIEIYDQQGNQLNGYSDYVELEKDTENGTGLGMTELILIVVIAVIVILVALMLLYMYMQNKRQDEEIVREEFECPECHNVVSEDDTVCPHCGAEFEEEAYKCPKCGAMLDPEDDECPECGYDFEDQDQMVLESDEDDEMEETDEEFEMDEEEFEELEE